MKKNYTFKVLIALLFFSSQLFSQVNVTFKVDMSNQTVSADGVHVAGSINDWSTDATIFTQEGTTNIYTATVSLNTGWHEYKFLNGNAWGTEESAGYPCAPSNGNRFLYINDSGNDVTLEAVPFNGCNADGTGFSFSLNVDMSSEASVSADGVHMTGAFNGWNPDNFNIPDVNGNIHSATLRLPTPSDYPISFEYKFLNGKGWGNEETPDSNCNTVANTNRIETISASGQSLYNIFNGCNYTFSTQVTTTFKVDMTGQSVSADGVHIVGSINGWNTTSNQLTQEGSTNIYSTDIILDTGWHEYKFLNGNAWGTEESAGYPCAPSNGNRFLYINDSGNDVTLEAVPFNGCNADGTGFSFSLNVDMSSEASVSADGVHMTGAFNGWNPDNFNIPDANGDIYSATLRLPTPSNYPISFEYKFLNGKGWGNEETPDANCGTVANNNRVETITSSGQNIYNVFNGCNYTLSLKENLLDNVDVTYTREQGLIINSQKSYNKLYVSIYDLSGRKINYTILSNTSNIQNTILVNSISKGLYIVNINDENNRKLTKKVLFH